ncbi:hypothetical protein [Streptomyces sp. NPDC096033]|uniref:hypothetical protein n=1 Tax=Streptomyces sp. NPDC096033 TaxID=3366071 RepID=UPI0037F1F24B
MDVVYASLKRRHPGSQAQDGEAAEAVDALWAHAQPADGLQHATARPLHDRIDLLLYFLSRDPSAKPDAVGRAHSLISRSHRTSSVLHQRYQAPEPPEATDPTDR